MRKEISRYCCVVKKLRTEVVKKVTDPLEVMPGDKPQDAAATITQSGKPNESMIRKLFNNNQLVDRCYSGK